MKNPPLPEKVILKSIQEIQQKVKKVGSISIIYLKDFPDFSNYKVEYIELPNFKLNYEIIKEDPIIKIRRKWAIQKKRKRKENPELVKQKAREYYKKNREKLLPKILENRKKRKNK